MLSEEDIRVRYRFGNAELLALKLEEMDTNKGMQLVSRH